MLLYEWRVPTADTKSEGAIDGARDMEANIEEDEDGGWDSNGLASKGDGIVALG